MGLFNFGKKPADTKKEIAGPYKESSTNLIYQLLFCDSIDLYKANTQPPYSFPFDILFSETSSAEQLQKIINDSETDPRIKMLAYNRLSASGYKADKKELLGVIVEISLDEGLDVLASFKNGTARYINQTGSVLIWETSDAISTELIDDLFSKSLTIIDQIGPWDKPRRPAPAKGLMRMNFLVSDGLYFGEGGIEVLFKDPMASPALTAATKLLQHLTEVSSKRDK